MNELQGFTAALYARVSTDDKGQDVETQIREMRTWCKRNGVVIGTTVTDTGREREAIYSEEVSATTLLNRPQLQQCIGRIQFGGGDIQILLAYDPSRLTRDKKLDEIQKMIPRCQIRFVSMGFGSLSADGKKNSDYQLVTGIKEVTDQLENDIRKERTRLGMVTKKMNGKHTGLPAKLMIAEDVAAIKRGEYDQECRREGRYVEPPRTEEDRLKLERDGKRHVYTTIIIPEDTIWGYAKKGLAINYVETRILGVKHPRLYNELKHYGRLEKYQAILKSLNENEDYLNHSKEKKPIEIDCTKGIE